MNKIFKLSSTMRSCLFLAMILTIASCEDDELIQYNPNQGIVQEVTDPFLQIQTPVVSFQAGTEKYGLDINVINGAKEISQVNVYSIFTDAESGGESNEVLLTSYEVVSPTVTPVIDSLTYQDLREGLMVNGSPLPESDLELAVGSGWKLRFVGVSPEGDEIPLGGNINIAVLSRFAGLYRAVETDYWRIGVQSGLADWRGQTRFIGSVDENTFSYNDFWGPFAWTGNSFRFDIDFTDNSITVPIADVLFSGNRVLTCEDDAAIFQNVPCMNSNVLIPNEVTGEHVIRITYGYFTDGSGPREFYEELVKIVD